MLSQLLESSPRRPRRHFSTVVSIIGHAVALSGAVVAAHPAPQPDDPQTVVTWHPPLPLPPTRCAHCSGAAGGSPAARTEIPLPEVPSGPIDELTLDVAERVNVSGEGIVISREEWRWGTAAEPGGPVESGAGRIVDREVVPDPANPAPRYPAELRDARIEGKVFARFVVDTTGRVVMGSVTVDASTHPAFSDAVIETLRRSRFAPAEFRGRKVAQLVSQPFVFLLRE